MHDLGRKGPAALQALLAATHGNRPAMDAFARMNAGTISPAAFFAPENVEAILAAAKDRPASTPTARAASG